MEENGFVQKNERFIIRILAKEYGKHNKGRNCILMGAVTLCIVTLTMVFGIATGKVQAEYMKAVRAAGTTASASIEGAGAAQYQKVLSLGYVKHAGRRILAGRASVEESAVKDEKKRAEFRLEMLDKPAWEEIIRPAYTDIRGSYPREKQEIMLSRRIMEAVGIEEPREGMKISLTVSIGLFRRVQEEFSLSGWYTDYADSPFDLGAGYISETKCRLWGYDMGKEADILICQSDDMDWRETEERLYQDVAGKGADLKVKACNTFAGNAVNRLAGGYGLAVFGAALVLSGMFFLIYNVMQISMAGDVRQMGLLNTIGATKRQIRKIYFGQIRNVLFLGAAAGMLISVIVLGAVIPGILGDQYLSSYGGAGGLKIFRPGILVAAVGFAVILTAGAAAAVIYRVVNVSCVESMNYVPSSGIRSIKKPDYRKRSEPGELWYMAWQNLIRNRGRFLLTIASLFLGMEAFLVTIVITKGSDYIHVIEKRPDFLIAGEFSEWGKEQGYGSEYKTRDAGEDPMETKGDSFALLYGNEYDEFSPVSQEVRDALLSLDGVEPDRSYVMEGAYIASVISRKGIAPLVKSTFPDAMGAQEKEGTGYGLEYSMIDGFNEDVVQILKDEELYDLKRYVRDKNLPVDMESLIEGTGVMILHDHLLTPKQEEQARQSVGEPVYFKTMRSKEDSIRWNQADAKERESMEQGLEDTSRQSETFAISGYMDNRAEGFPDIRQTWHGAEGDIYYLISEKGFKKLPTEKKTLYMELNVRKEREPQVKTEIQNIITEENHRRDTCGIGDGRGEEMKEAGIFCISKSDLRAEAANYIRGNRTILGSVGAVLLFAGLTNFFNVMATGILARRKEFKIMESIGMTRRQKYRLLIAEGMYYCMIEGILLLTAGSGILWLVCRYMESKLSYFECSYPWGGVAGLITGLAGICFGIVAFTCQDRYN